MSKSIPPFIVGFVFGLGLGMLVASKACPPTPAPAGQPAPVPAAPVAEKPAADKPAPMHSPVQPVAAEPSK